MISNQLHEGRIIVLTLNHKTNNGCIPIGILLKSTIYHALKLVSSHGMNMILRSLIHLERSHKEQGEK